MAGCSYRQDVRSPFVNVRLEIKRQDNEVSFPQKRARTYQLTHRPPQACCSDAVAAAVRCASSLGSNHLIFSPSSAIFKIFQMAPMVQHLLIHSAHICIIPSVCAALDRAVGDPRRRV